MLDREMENEIIALKLQMAKTKTLIRGAVAVGTIVFSGIQWYALREVQGIDELTARMATMERQVAVLEVKTQYLVNKEKMKEGIGDLVPPGPPDH